MIDAAPFDTERFARLSTNLREAVAAERAAAAELVRVSAAWGATNDALNVHDLALDEFLTEVRKAAVGTSDTRRQFNPVHGPRA